MSKNKTVYRQVKLEKDLGNNKKLVNIAWIPAYAAKLDKTVSLKDVDDEIKDGWKVVFVGASKEVDELEKQEDAQRQWAKTLDKKNKR